MLWGLGLQCVCEAVNLIKMTLKTKSSMMLTIIERSDPSVMWGWQHSTTFGSYNIKANMILECKDLRSFHYKILMMKGMWLEGDYNNSGTHEAELVIRETQGLSFKCNALTHISPACPCSKNKFCVQPRLERRGTGGGEDERWEKVCEEK